MSLDRCKLFLTSDLMPVLSGDERHRASRVCQVNVLRIKWRFRHEIQKVLAVLETRINGTVPATFALRRREGDSLRIEIEVQNEEQVVSSEGGLRLPAVETVTQGSRFWIIPSRSAQIGAKP